MKHTCRCYIFTCCIGLLWSTQDLNAQLDSIHYIPPMHSRDDEQVQQFLYLSTPETAPFPVTISYGKFDAATTTWTYVDSVIMLSNNSPEVLEVGFADYSTILVSAAELNQPIAQRGIIARAPKKFYANLRVRQNAQAGSLTAKGRAGLGTTFRIGHLLNTPGRNKSNFIGIMATEDNTQVTISGYAPNIALQNAGIGIPDVYTPGSTISFTLNAGESYVVSVYCRVENPDNSDALMGALVSSSKAIAVNCGSWWAGHPNAGTDIGIDQIAPLESTGTKHVLVRGEGSFTTSSQNLETPIVVAHYDNTAIYINGSATSEYTLNTGEYAVVHQSFYTNDVNMYIESSLPVFMYQSTAGGPNTNNAGFNFIPPVSCQIGASVDNISQIDTIGNLVFATNLFVVAYEGCELLAQATGNQGVLDGPYAVPGSAGYVTYSGTGYTGDLAVYSDCSLQVGILGQSGDRGWSSYFSGLGDLIEPEVILQADTCLNTLLVHMEHVDTLQWYFNGEAITNPVPDTMLLIAQNGTYTVTGLLSLHCDSLIYDTATFVVNWLPTIQIETSPAGCTFGELGAVSILVSGASGDYSYCIDGGAPQVSNVFAAVAAGTHTIQIKDSNGCVLRDTAVVTEIPFQQITESICIDSSILISGVVFDISHPSDTLLFEGASGCDSAIVIQVSFYAPLDTIFEQTFTCDPLEVGLTMLHFACDSVAIINTILEDFGVSILPDNATLPFSGSIELALQSNPPGMAPASVLWSPATNLSCDTCLIVFANPLQTTTYEVIATSPEGCIATASATVIVIAERKVYAPNIFSPNGDGIHDKFALSGGSDLVNIRQFKVFDRWGGQVFQSFNAAPNDLSAGWNGQHRGQPATAGTYGWFAEVEFADGAVLLFKGAVTLIR